MKGEAYVIADIAVPLDGLLDTSTSQAMVDALGKLQDGILLAERELLESVTYKSPEQLVTFVQLEQPGPGIATIRVSVPLTRTPDAR